ncbi:MAG TPA: hypothetical protein VJT75_11770 [Thermoleophilaceae bacterium]|nr:hypothetical protein [Thermoleophilaceae bacterium]
MVCDAGDPDVHLWHVDATKDWGPGDRLVGHQHGVFAADFSPQAHYLATASEDMTVRLWDLDAKEQAAVCEHPGDVETLAWSASGELLATGCDDGKARLWSSEGHLVRVIDGASGSARRVSFSPSGSFLLVGSYDGHFRLHSTDTGEVVNVIQRPLQWERAGIVLDDSTAILGTFGGSPLVEHLRSDEGSPTAEPKSASLPVHTLGINTVAADQAGVLLLGTDCGLIVRSAGSEEVVAQFPTLLTALAVAPGGEIAAGDYLGALHILTPEGELLVECDTRGGPLNSLAWLPDGTLGCGSYDGSLRRVGVDGAISHAVRAHAGPIKSVAWSQPAQRLVAASSDNTMTAWALDGPAFHHAATYAAPDLVLINAVAAAPSEPWLALVSRDRHLRRWWPLSGDIDVLPAVHAKSVKAVAVAQSNRVIATGSYDGTVCAWHFDPAGTLSGWHRVACHGKPGVASMTLRQDGTLVSVGWNGTVALWSAVGDLMSFGSLDVRPLGGIER